MVSLVYVVHLVCKVVYETNSIAAKGIGGNTHVSRKANNALLVNNEFSLEVFLFFLG